MKWIRTHKGTVINKDNITHVNIERTITSYVVVANLNIVQSTTTRDNTTVYKYATESLRGFDTEADAKEYIRKMFI